MQKMAHETECKELFQRAMELRHIVVPSDCRPVEDLEEDWTEPIPTGPADTRPRGPSTGYAYVRFSKAVQQSSPSPFDLAICMWLYQLFAMKKVIRVRHLGMAK